MPEHTSFWLTPPVYWLPAHFPLSAWTTHAPFAAYVVDRLRPQNVVELGTHLGFSSFAFAEASTRLAVPMTVHSIDTWEGDDHAGFYGEDVYAYVRRVVDEDYPDRVALYRGLFSDARPAFANASVDVLHIDGRHGYEDVREDYDDWIDTVRDGGVVLFHDIAERENGFGVWRLWEELAESGSAFAFGHGHGLGVLGVGDTSRSPLRPLFEADKQTATRIRADFERLGEVVARQTWLESQAEEAERAWAEVRRGAVREAELRARIDALESSTSWRVTAPLRAVSHRLKAD